MLLRLDPDKNAIALMSIPRDLKVEIPGYGTEKFNAAYAYGGAKLTLQVVKELTGLPINHVVNVDFLGFVRAVDAIGCVYVDVDRRYYHSNVGVPPSEQYAEINIQPGYQLLCGKKALQYVRYRHTDTDLVRAARQQDFLSAARQRVPIGDLVLGRNELIDIFTEYTTSDISDKETMLEVLKLFIASRNAAINEVHFPAELGAQLRLRLARQRSKGRSTSSSDRSERRPARLARIARKAGQDKKRRRQEEEAQDEAVAAPKPRGSDGLVSAREAGEAEAKAVARKVGGGFPVFYPARLPPGAAYEETNPYYHVVDPRVYHLKDTDGKRHVAYRMVIRSTSPMGPTTSGSRGFAAGPTRRSSMTQRNAHHPRPRIRDLRRRRPGKADRLAPWREHLLGGERPAQRADQRPDARHGALGACDRPQPEAPRRRRRPWRLRPSASSASAGWGW